MPELFLPVLSHFQNKNIWIASLGRLRYKVTPGEEALAAELWEGPWAYELSKVEEKQDFPLTEEGLSTLSAWLTEKAQEMEGRAKRTLEEELARRGQ